VLLSEDGVIRTRNLPPTLQTASSTDTQFRGRYEGLMAAYERELIVEALKEAKGVRAKAARLLGITPRVLSYQAGKLGIEPRKFRT
jgi:Nif-specific regulatory protein